MSEHSHSPEPVSMKHYIKYEKAWLKMDSTSNDIMTYDLKTVYSESGVFYVFNDGELFEELNHYEWDSIHVNVIPLAVEIDGRTSTIKVLTKSAARFERDRNIPGEPAFVPRGGCIWATWYKSDKSIDTSPPVNKKNIYFTDNSYDFGVEYEYAIPLPAVTHFAMHIEADLTPETVYFITNNMEDINYLDTLLNELDFIRLGFYGSSYKMYPPDTKNSRAYIDKLLIFDSSDGTIPLDSLMYSTN